MDEKECTRQQTAKKSIADFARNQQFFVF